MTIKATIYASLLLFVILFGFSACGNHSDTKKGGGSSSTSKNSKLAANAGKDETIGIGDEYYLDASSSKPHDLIQKYYWLKVSGPSIVFQQDVENQIITPAEVGTYVFRLFIFSADGKSDTDDITLTVVGKKPSANAGPDQNVIVSTTVTLDGSNSEIKSAGTLNYLWSLVSFPSSDQPIFNQTAKTTTFVPKEIGQYVFSLIVYTDDFTSEPDYVTINSNNILPVANAGPDRSVFINNTITLDGSASTYPEGSVPLFIWEQLSGPVTITLANKQTNTPSFFAETKGTYTFSLTLKVNSVTSNRDLVTVTVIDENTADIPIANPGPDQNGFVNEVVELDGTKSTSSKNAPLVYTWALAGGDAKTINLSNTSSPKVSLIATKPGTYQISLMVYDGSYSSAVATALVNIYNRADTNLPPQFFEPQTSLTLKLGEPIMLDIGAIDYEGDPIRYNSTVKTSKDATYRIENGQDPTIILKPSIISNTLQTFNFTFMADDGITQNSRQLEIRLQPHPYGRNDSRTALIGRVTDVQGSPLQNATVHCGITSARTDKNGRFSLIKIPDGDNIPVFVDGRNAYTQAEGEDKTRKSFYELETIAVAITPFINNKLEHDITLYKVFSEDLTQTHRDQTTTVTTFNEPNLKDFKLSVPASSPMGISSAYTATIAAYEVDKNLAPSEWNYYFNPSLLMKVRPHHVKYRIPAPITIPNKDKYAANTILTLWKLDMANAKYIPINDIKVQDKTMFTEAGGLTENGYLFTALSVSGTIRTSEKKATIAYQNLLDIFKLKKEATELKKKLATIIAQDKMSIALGAMSQLAPFEKAYKNAFLDNSSLANMAYLRLKTKYTKGTDLAKDIQNAATVGDELLEALKPFDNSLNNFLKTIKRDSILTVQINNIQDLLATKDYNLKNDAEDLRIRDHIAKRKAQIALINQPLQLTEFTNETFTEIMGAKIQEPIALSAKLYTQEHPYNKVLLKMDDIIQKLTAIIDNHSQTNEREIMSVLQVLNQSGGVDEVIAIKTFDALTYIANLDNRTDLLGKTVRIASFSKTLNLYGTSRAIVLGKESATDLDVYMNQEAQLIIYEQPEEALKDFPSTVEIQKADQSVFLKALNVNTFIEAPIGSYNAKAISKKQKTTSIPFNLPNKKSYFIHFGQIEINTIENVIYQNESLVFYNQALNISFNDIKVNDLVILPAGIYTVKSASTSPEDYWSGTVTLNIGETKRPFGTLQYASFSLNEMYPIEYSLLATNGKPAYKNITLGNAVVALPGYYRLKAAQDSNRILPLAVQILVKQNELINPFGSISVSTYSSLPYTYDNFQLEFFKEDDLVVTNLAPGKNLVVPPGRYRMRVVGMTNIMKYYITVTNDDIASVIGLVRFTEPNKLYNIYQDSKIIYQNTGAGKAVLLTPGLYTIDAVEEDGIPPQVFNVVFNSVFSYPDDTIINKN